MRALTFLVVFGVVSGCTCAGCGAKPVVVDAGTVVAMVKEPASPPPSPVDAGPRELPWEVRENPISEETLITKYAADCRYVAPVEFDDMDGPKAADDECLARAMDQNCAPDSFGCWDNVEACRDECAKPCSRCQTVCGDSCEACKATCDGGACVTTCATKRAACRKECLYDLQACRTGPCMEAFARCTAASDARVKKACPDCAALSSCFINPPKPGLPAPSTDECMKRFPGNAKECVEWCSNY